MKNHLLVAKDEASEHYKKFLDYFKKEMDIIESIGYTDSQIFLDQFPERAKVFILGAKRDKNYYSGMEEFPQDVKEDCLVGRVLYVSRVVDFLRNTSKSAKYAPAQGSFWEFLGKDLEKLALDIQEEVF